MSFSKSLWKISILEEIIEHYKNNRVVWEGLKKKGYTDIQASFISIPFEVGIKHIQHWKFISNEWQKIN